MITLRIINKNTKVSRQDVKLVNIKNIEIRNISTKLSQAISFNFNLHEDSSFFHSSNLIVQTQQNENTQEQFLFLMQPKTVQSLFNKCRWKTKLKWSLYSSISVATKEKYRANIGGNKNE